MLRMPSRVVFPFGYRISGNQISDTEMDRRDPNAMVSGTTTPKPLSS